jgi:hypothetical protein
VGINLVRRQGWSVEGGCFKGPSIGSFWRYSVIVFGMDVVTVVYVVMVETDVVGILASVVWKVNAVSVLHMIFVGSVEQDVTFWDKSLGPS